MSNSTHTFLLFVATPTEKVYEGEAQKIAIPSVSGDIVVLAGHESIMSTIDAGELIITDMDGTIHNFAAHNGVVHVDNSKIAYEKTRVSVLLESTVPVDEIDTETTKIAVERARIALTEKDDMEFDVNSTMMREMNKIRVKNRHSR